MYMLKLRLRWMFMPLLIKNHRRKERKQLRRDFRSLLRIFKVVTKIGYPQSKVEALKLNKAIRDYKEIMNRIDETIITDPEIYLEDFKNGGTDVVKLSMWM